MGDLKDDFLDKMARFGLNENLFEHPEAIMTRIEGVIDGMASLSAADRTRLKRLFRAYGTALWCLIQYTVEGR